MVWTLWKLCLCDNYYVFVTTSLLTCFMKLFGNIVKLWALYVLPLCHDICDYLMLTQLDAKVCVILVSWRPVCVIVIEIRLCDSNNEFHLCDGLMSFICVTAIVWQQLSSVCVMAKSFVFVTACHVAFGWLLHVFD